jgi:hypothetical protein
MTLLATGEKIPAFKQKKKKKKRKLVSVTKACLISDYSKSVRKWRAGIND